MGKRLKITRPFDSILKANPDKIANNKCPADNQKIVTANTIIIEELVKVTNQSPKKACIVINLKFLTSTHQDNQVV